MESKQLESFEKRFKKRYKVKKISNAVINLLIGMGGISTLFYAVLVNGKNLVDRLRFMTFNGTIFTSVVCLAFAVICAVEAWKYTEVTRTFMYYLRLSSATTELVILLVVLFGLLPIVSDKPDISSYNGVMMHLVIPIATLATFVLNDAPIGRIGPLEPFHGTWFITIYAAVSLIVFATGILPSSMAPYSFLDFEHHSLLFPLACLIGIYATAYLMSLMLYKLNRRFSWIWFRKKRK
ncbi:MAG: hypothetical protein IKE38_03600 [Erysipelotrichaceae bacterium]|nr:hypothetical protein [Erysipelotrichaceae bacterium]